MSPETDANDSTATSSMINKEDTSHTGKSEDIVAENYSQILEVQNLMYIEEAFADALDYVSFM